MSLFHHVDRKHESSIDSVVLELRDTEKVITYLQHLEEEIADDILHMEFLVNLSRLKGSSKASTNSSFPIPNVETEKKLETIAHNQTRVDGRIESLILLAEFKSENGKADVAYKNLVMALHTLDYIHNPVEQVRLLSKIIRKAVEMGHEIVDTRLLEVVKEKVENISADDVKAEAGYELNLIAEDISAILGEKAGREWYEWSASLVHRNAKSRALLVKSNILLKAREAEFKEDCPGIVEVKSEAILVRDAENRDAIMRDLAGYIEKACKRKPDFPGDVLVKELADNACTDIMRMEILLILSRIFLIQGKMKEAEDTLLECHGLLNTMEEGILKDMCIGRFVEGVAKACATAGSLYFTREVSEVIKQCGDPGIRATCYIALAEASATVSPSGTPPGVAVADYLIQAERDMRKVLSEERGGLFLELCKAIISCHRALKS